MIEYRNYKEMKDCELVEKFLNQKDHKAYQILYSRYYNAIKNFVGPIIRNDSFKEDLTQEIFIKVFKKLHLYNPSYKFSGWIYKIASNTAIDFLRKEIKMKTQPIEKPNKEGEIYAITVPDKGLNPLQVYALQQRKDFLISLLNSLEFRQRDLLISKFIKEETYKKLSEEMDIPINTLKTKVLRIKKDLKKTYNNYYHNY